MKEGLGLFENLSKQVRYAKNSYSRNLLYEAHGAIKMARELGAITKEEFFTLDHDCVYDGINNPKYFNNPEARKYFKGVGSNG